MSLDEWARRLVWGSEPQAYTDGMALRPTAPASRGNAPLRGAPDTLEQEIELFLLQHYIMGDLYRDGGLSREQVHAIFGQSVPSDAVERGLGHLLTQRLIVQSTLGRGFVLTTEGRAFVESRGWLRAYEMTLPPPTLELWHLYIRYLRADAEFIRLFHKARYTMPEDMLDESADPSVNQLVEYHTSSPTEGDHSKKRRQGGAASDPSTDVLKQQHVARTYTVPLSVPSQLYAFLATSRLNDTCKQAVIGLYKHVMASILRQIQQAVNRACREKGQIARAVRTAQWEQRPPTSNTYYRRLFRDTSKRGEVSTYLVKNALLGQNHHLDRKFPRLRTVLAKAPLPVIAPFLMCNYVPQRLRAELSGRFGWKLAHVRPQLRGMRRLMERAQAFDPALQITSKNGEFAQLRAGVNTLLQSAPRPPGLQIALLDKILDRFQQGHVLHVLLLSREEVYGLYPKLVPLKGATYAAPAIKQQLALFRQFCERHRAALEALIKRCLSGLVRIEPNESQAAITEAVREHEQHLAFLKAKKYGMYHALRKRRALAVLRADMTWWHYLECGVLPSERYLKALAKLVSALPKVRQKAEAALAAIVPATFLMKLGKLRGCAPRTLVKQFLGGFTAENCTNSPFTSPRNRKRLSPLDLTSLNNDSLVIRPGNTSNDLLTDFLRKGQAIPLRFAPTEILMFYTGSVTGRLDEGRVKAFVCSLLTQKKYKNADIETICKLISFNGIKPLSRKTIHAKRGALSEVARFFVDPVLEINLFANKRLRKGLHRVKEIISNPEVKLAPICILPVTDVNNVCLCQLIFKSEKVQPEFKSSIRCMKGIEIGELREEEIVGIDVNQEDENKLYVAPDWDSSAQYIQTNQLERKLRRRIYNEAQDKQFTAYIHNDRRSARVSEPINALSGALKANLSHLKKVKQMKKRVQGAYGKTRLHAIALATTFYTRIVHVAKVNGLQLEVEALQDVLIAIREIPKHRVHDLAQLRDRRNAKIQKILALLKKWGYSAVVQLQHHFVDVQKWGKKAHRQKTEMTRLQRKINNLRKEIDQKVGRLIAMSLCEIHPGKLVYEALEVKHQGLKGVLGEITKYMPDIMESVAKAIEIADLYGQSKGISIQTKVYGVHPGGTSSPPHIPTGLDFERGGKRGWHEVTIPATEKDGVSYPQLKINSHILACQKLCEKVRFK